MVRRWPVVLIACFCLLGVTGAASEAEKPAVLFLGREDGDRPYWKRNLFKRFLTDQKYLATSWWPAEARRYEFSVPLVVAVAGARGSPSPGHGVDFRWQRSLQSWTDGGRSDIAEGFTRLCDAETALVLLGGTYLVSRWTRNERTSRAASLSAEALMSTAVYSTMLKRLTQRTRPAFGGTGEFFVDQPEGEQQPTSFPSGHAMGAFAVAAVFSGEFRDKKWVPWVAYGTASLVALSRVGLGRHFPADVLAGAVLGRSIGRMVTYRSNGEDKMRPVSRLEPLFEPANGGVGLVYRRSW
jgi:hypothetical protein